MTKQKPPCQFGENTGHPCGAESVIKWGECWLCNEHAGSRARLAQPLKAPQGDRRAKVLAFQLEVAYALDQCRRTDSTEEKARIMWELAYVKLREIEELRPAGGFPKEAMEPPLYLCDPITLPPWFWPAVFFLAVSITVLAVFIVPLLTHPTP